VHAGLDGRIAVVDRRTFLVMGVAALGLAGCTTDAPPPPSPTAPTLPSGPNDPDAELRATVARSEAALIVAYRTAISSRPELAGDLRPFLAHHEQHLERVLPGSDPQALVTPTAVASQSRPAAGASAAEPPGTASPSPPAAAEPPGTASASASASATATERDEAALTALAAAEREAHVERVSACDGASAPGLARDLCLIAASEAQHAAELDALAEEVSER
jgi:hypothetical protein